MSANRTLVRNGQVLTMDPKLGDFESADVLIEGGEIVAVGPSLSVTDAHIIEAEGHLVLPGLIDTHRHTWQSLVRGICGDWTLGDYFFGIRQGISSNYTADDVQLGNQYGAVEALNAGVTTLLDFSHCNNTPDHSDAAIQGLQESGIRAAFSYGFFESSPGASQFGEHEARIRDFHRIADTYFSSNDSRITLGVALSELFSLPWGHSINELEAARERANLVVNHAGCIFGSQLTNGIVEMEELGLLNSDMVHVHCTSFGDAEWDALARSGGKVSISVQTEMNMGFGRPVFERCRRHGIAPTMSADVVSLNSGDLWHELRFGLSCARADRADGILAAGTMPDTVSIPAREALDWVTVNAADAMGLGHRIGSLTPGKRADLILVGGNGFEQHPRIDPYATLVFQTAAADVRTVIVDGRIVKHEGIMTGTDHATLTRRADHASERILSRVHAAGRHLPGTPPGALRAIDPIAQEFYAQALASVEQHRKRAASAMS